MKRALLLFPVLWLLSPWAWADPTAEAEIRHLLAFIHDSGCTFVRNGEEHGLPQAHRRVLFLNPGEEYMQCLKANPPSRHRSKLL